jgi:biopolymer transport protein ExbB
MVRWGRWIVLGLALAASPGLATARAQDEGAGGPPASSSGEAASAPEPRGVGQIGRGSVWELVRQANPMLWPLVLCSVVTLGFALERGFALRKGRVVPRDFINRFMDRLSGGKLDRDRATELCRSNDSPVARLFGHAVRYWGQPASEIRQALDHDAAAELLDLRKNVRVLNATATLAPLLGLLGTVVGMIEAFEAIGSGQGAAGVAKSEALAHGISLALMTTGFGLAVAVVSVAFYYYFLQRIDVLARALDEQASQVIDLIAAESSRSPRGPLGGSADLPRLESRPLGRMDSL